MSNGNQESGKSNVTDKVTDIDLQAALDEAMQDETPEEIEASREQHEEPQEEPTEEPQPEAAQAPEEPPPPIQEEPTDPRERSALGRKVKGLELEIQRLTQALQNQKLTPQQPASEPTSEDDNEMPEFVTTPEELRKALKVIEREKTREVQGYQIGYGQRFLEVGKDDPLYEEVETEMMANYNQKVTGNPAVDAELNYAKAKAAVLTKRLSTPPPPPKKEPAPLPGKGDKPQGSGVTFSSRNAKSPTATPPIDEFAADFIRRTGMSEDSVREALGTAKPRR